VLHCKLKLDEHSFGIYLGIFRNSVNRKFWRASIALVLSVVLSFGLILGLAPNSIAAEQAVWQKVELPTKANLLDIGFTETNPNHGWLIGTESTLLETNDGGKTWATRQLGLGEGNYRFVSINFNGNEGWIAGKPSLLLHTEDGGQSWTRIGLSSKLPGEPTLVNALGSHSAELATDVGAIYRTQDNGQNWKALVTQAVGAVRNLYRDRDGRYIAVSAKGNFYSTWSPGDAAWLQHNRNSSRRVQNMGYTPDGRTWMLNRGGRLQFSEVGTVDAWEKPQNPKSAKGIGLLDLSYQDTENVWVTGGSSTLLHSTDGGKNWVREESLDAVGANFYSVDFVSQDRGFILGQTGTLLAYSKK